MRLDHLLSERKARAAGVRRGPEESPDLKLRACVSERSSSFFPFFVNQKRDDILIFEITREGKKVKYSGSSEYGPRIGLKEGAVRARRCAGRRGNMVKRNIGPRRMPWSVLAMKGAASCEKPGGGAHIL